MPSRFHSLRSSRIFQHFATCTTVELVFSSLWTTSELFFILSHWSDKKARMGNSQGQNTGRSVCPVSFVLVFSFDSPKFRSPAKEGSKRARLPEDSCRWAWADSFGLSQPPPLTLSYTRKKRAKLRFQNDGFAFWTFSVIIYFVRGCIRSQHIFSPWLQALEHTSLNQTEDWLLILDYLIISHWITFLKA